MYLLIQDNIVIAKSRDLKKLWQKNNLQDQNPHFDVDDLEDTLRPLSDDPFNNNNQSTHVECRYDQHEAVIQMI